MTIATLTTLDLPVRLMDETEHLLAIYSRVLEERPDDESNRHYNTAHAGPHMTITIEGHRLMYDVSDIILPRPINTDVSEVTMICVAKLSESYKPGSHLVFTCYTQYSEWAVKMDVLRIEDDDKGTLSDFLNLSIHDKQRLLGLI